MSPSLSNIVQRLNTPLDDISFSAHKDTAILAPVTRFLTYMLGRRPRTPMPRAGRPSIRVKAYNLMLAFAPEYPEFNVVFAIEHVTRLPFSPSCANILRFVSVAQSAPHRTVAMISRPGRGTPATIRHRWHFDRRLRSWSGAANLSYQIR